MYLEIEKINKQEILKYLSYRGRGIPDEIDSLIENTIKELLKIARPRYTYKVFDLERLNGKIFLKGTDIYLPGKDIEELLHQSRSCIVFVSTLGLEVDKHIRALQIRDLTKSIVLDSCASSGVESICNSINDRFGKEYRKRNQYLTDRFSPGYGDMPLDIQAKIGEILDIRRTIGVNITSSGIMIPRKSVSAIIGISNIKQKKRFSGCENCSMFMKCEYRKNGKICRGD